MSPSTPQEDKEFNPTTRDTKEPLTAEEWKEITIRYKDMYNLMLKEFYFIGMQHKKDMKGLKQLMMAFMITFLVLGFVLGMTIV